MGAYQEKILELREVAARVGLPSGFHHPRTELVREGDHLVAQVTGFILSDKGGPVTRTTRSVTRRTRPWWIPRFVWRRIPVEHGRATLEVQPLWTYPESTIQVPRLGRGRKDVGILVYEDPVTWPGREY